MQYLCKAISKEEWSGVLFYRIEGSITDLENFSITVEDLYPMDHGSGVYTEYEFSDTSVIGYQMKNKHLLGKDMRQGHVHSHNSMDVFFSGTDKSELHDNSQHYNYYFSLIVNNDYDLCAMLAQRVTYKDAIERIVSFKGDDGEPINSEVERIEDIKEVVMLYECDIVGDEPDLLEDSFKERVNEIKSQIPVTTSGYGNWGTYPGGYGGGSGFHGGTQKEIDFGKKNGKPKKLEMDKKLAEKILVRWIYLNKDVTVNIHAAMSYIDKEITDTIEIDQYLESLDDKFEDFLDGYPTEDFFQLCFSIMDQFESVLGIEIFNLLVSKEAEFSAYTYGAAESSEEEKVQPLKF